MPEFVHLHVHSHYSLLEGLSKVKKLVKAAKERGFSALALTDYGSMYGAIEFYQACQAEEIKPIIGFEAYVAANSRLLKEKDEDKKTYHLVLLAKNYNGYKNLMQLSSLGHLEGIMDGKPRLDKELLQKFGQDIIALSACIKGEVPSLVKDGKYDEAKTKALEYQNIFGAGNFYLELQDHPAIEKQMIVNTELIKMSKETGIPVVATRDVHYLNPDDAEAQDILVCIREGWKVGQDNRESYVQVDRSFNKAADIASRFRHIPEAIENSVKIAAQIDIQIELNKWHFAPIDLPPGKTADEVLTERTWTALPKYYDPVTDEIKKRLEFELGVIQKKGYSPYFICVSDYVNYAKANGIVETTRGSAAGSLASFVLGITTVDPIRFKLPFERFLNPFRPSPPDIDTDFADNRRDDMISYVTQKYGKDKVAQIITFGTMAARASVRDVGRALGLSYSFCDQVAKLIPMGSQGFAMTIERALKEEPDLKKLYDTNADVKKLLDLARKVEGCARHTSIHAAGVVISPTPLIDFTPVQYEVGGTRLTTQYEMKSVETAGVLKMDFLGIRNLSILGTSVEIVEKTTGDKIDIYSLPHDDKKTFEMLSRGETMGTFQLGGSGMTRWLKELRPSTIDDIMAMVALYRPGPMDSIPEYIRRKHNPELVTYFDPRLKDILGASFGLLVYQEDVMLTAIVLAGYDWTEADKFRKAMGKKIPEEMAKQKDKFYKGCAEIGKIKKDIVDTMWTAIEPFAAYGFGKAHAASYGIVAYQTSYMKAHYPVQYMTAVLQAEAGDADKVAAIVHECRRLNIEVLPPDINESFRNFAMVSKPGEPGRIRFGLTAIKNVGEHICEVLYQERKNNGQFKDLEDLLKRVKDKDLNKKSVESLAQAGALDGFGYDRGVLLANSEIILNFSKQSKEEEQTGQNSLFSGTAITVGRKLILKEAVKATLDDKLKWEKNLLGVYVSSHPFLDYAEALKQVLTNTMDLEGHPRDSWIISGGVVGSLKKKITKKGSPMMFAAIEDMTGSAEILVFPKIYEQTQEYWKEGNIVCVIGKTPKEEGDNKIFVERAYLLDKNNVQQLAQQLSLGNSLVQRQKGVVPTTAPVEQAREQSVIINLSKDELTEHTDTLKDFLNSNPGSFQVLLKVGSAVIKTKSKIAWNDEIKKHLESVVGEGKMEVV